MFILGWFTGWVAIVAGILLIEIFRTRRESVRREIQHEMMAAREKQAVEAAAESKKRLDDLEKDPVAKEALDGLRETVERVVRRQGVTIAFPSGVQPEVLSGLLVSMAAMVNNHLEISKAMHEQLKLLDDKK